MKKIIFLIPLLFSNCIGECNPNQKVQYQSMCIKSCGESNIESFTLHYEGPDMIPECKCKNDCKK